MSSSVVWEHFKLQKDDTKFAVCKHCFKKISRGTAKSTSPLLKHLKSVHPLLKLNKTNKTSSTATSERPQSNTQGLLVNTFPSANDPDDPGFDDRSSFTSTVQSNQSKSRPIDTPLLGESVPSCSSTYLEPVRPSSPVSECSIQESPPIFRDTAIQNISVDIPSPTSIGLDESSTEFLTPSPRFQIQSPCSRQKKTSTQPTLSAFVDAKSKFKPGDQRASKITNLIARMICIDSQPFSIVEDEGFKNLIAHLEPRYKIPDRKYFSNNKIPDMYNIVLKSIKKELENVLHVGITTDMWTSVANTDYMAITLHYITNDYEYRHLCLEVVPFPEINHTAEHIRRFLTEMLKSWGVDIKVVAIVRDNARNIVSALEESPFHHLPCLAHTLQLVLKHSVLDSKVFSNLQSTAKKIVGHFKHSSGATKVLKQCQVTANVKRHRLVQDEPTRWNCTLHMLKRLKEQRSALLLAEAELGNLPCQFSYSQWAMVENIIPMLETFHSATEQVSSANVSASEVRK